MHEKTTLGNGITLHSLTNSNLNTFCIAVYVKAGCLYESVSDNGITHLLEHTIFKNISNKYSESFYDMLAFNGLNFTGSTYKEFMCFMIDGPISAYDFACDVMCGIFDVISITPSSFKLEKSRIKAEIWERDERHTVKYNFLNRVWSDSFCGKTILGTSSVVEKISLCKLEDYRKNIFCVDNCFFYITGNISETQRGYLLDKISQINISKHFLSRNNCVEVSEIFFHRDKKIITKDNGCSAMWFGFDVDTRRYSIGIIDLIFKILFTYENALFNMKLSEDTPLLYSYNSVNELYCNLGCMCFDFDFLPENAEMAVSAIVEAICDLKQGHFHFDANLNCLLSSWTRLLDNPVELNWNMAYCNHILNMSPVDYSQTSLGRFANVTKEAVVQAAKEIFTRRNLTVLFEGKIGKKSVDSLNKILDRLD